MLQYQKINVLNDSQFDSCESAGVEFTWNDIKNNYADWQYILDNFTSWSEIAGYTGDFNFLSSVIIKDMLFKIKPSSTISTYDTIHGILDINNGFVAYSPKSQTNYDLIMQGMTLDNQYRIKTKRRGIKYDVYYIEKLNNG